MNIFCDREIWIVRSCVALTFCFLAKVLFDLVLLIQRAISVHDFGTIISLFIFSLVFLFGVYGILLYQICLIGYYTRKKNYCSPSREELESIYDRENPPTLSILVPSYKEERSVVWQTLFSAALSEYPEKNVVLLIDDPYFPQSQEDKFQLRNIRSLPAELQSQFATLATHFLSEKKDFVQRCKAGSLDSSSELHRLASHYEDIASWIRCRIQEFSNYQSLSVLSHGERFFIDEILMKTHRQHQATAKELRQKIAENKHPEDDFYRHHYARLAGLFNVHFSSFERKKYCNLSHEVNKAMNLNSYIGLMGKSFIEVKIKGQWKLYDTWPAPADFSIPSADYINTIDADSLMTSDHLLRLVHVMERPENSKIAVIQSPVSAIPGCPHGIERAAGVYLDMQFLSHQGFAHWQAAFWVGANALLRSKALEDIRELRNENDSSVSVFIQDRTVIEDTESSIDIVNKGWKIYNYPERMSYSAMPADFGSLLIQRRRWANGGLIILPKLFSYFIKAPKNFNLFKEFFMRFHYLASTTFGCLTTLLLFLLPLREVPSSTCLSLFALPSFFLYARNLKLAGYKFLDIFHILTLNMILFPVIVGGVLKQLQQMITGKKIPFGRTPKVQGRTAAPALYCLSELMVAGLLFSLTLGAIQNQNWWNAAFDGLNGLFFLYAVVRFIGLRAIAEDIAVGFREHLGETKTRKIVALPN